MSKIVPYSLGCMGSQGHCCNPPGSLCTSRSCVCVFGRESSTFSWASDSDKAACPLPLYVIFMDLTSRRSHGLERVQFGDIRMPPLLFFNDVVHEASTDCHFWCALEPLAAECDAVGMRSSTPKFAATTLWVHMGRISNVASPQSVHFIVDIWVLQWCTQFGESTVENIVHSIFKLKSKKIMSSVCTFIAVRDDFHTPLRYVHCFVILNMWKMARRELSHREKLSSIRLCSGRQLWSQVFEYWLKQRDCRHEPPRRVSLQAERPRCG